MPKFGKVYIFGKTTESNMRVYFNLTYPSREVSPIRVVITNNGKVYRKSVGISTQTKSWNGKRTGVQSKDAALRLIRIGLESVLDEFSTDKQVTEALARVDHGRWCETPVATQRHSGRQSLWEYLAEWCERDNAAKRQRKNTVKLLARLMGCDDDWEDVDSAYYFRLVQRMNAERYSKNYQGSVIAKLKTVMSEGEKLKYHSNQEYKTFNKPSNQVDSVYMTQEELDRIWALELTDALEQKARDMFIIGCYTGARWEDYSTFSLDNIDGKEFRYIQRKTGARVTIPLSPRLKATLKRNGGHAPLIGDIVFNRTIKVVCMRAGITDAVQVRESKGDAYEHKTVPKYKMVSSHTCRRTMCTLLDKAGVPHKNIMVISGHKSLASFERYLRQTSKDVEESLAKVKFFK